MILKSHFSWACDAFIHHFTAVLFHNVSSWKQKEFLGPSASHDIVITQFGNYKSWLQSLPLFLGACVYLQMQLLSTVVKISLAMCSLNRAEQRAAESCSAGTLCGRNNKEMQNVT